MAINISNNLSYMGLDSWVLANIIQLATFDFCRRFLNKNNDPSGRMFDQMTQAARSGQANIAEGSARRQTSTETEMKLLDVARASLNELAGDFMFILMCRGEACWTIDDERYKTINAFRLDAPNYGRDYLNNVMQHIINQRKRLDAWLLSEDISLVANTLLILCMRVIRMLEKQLSSNLEKFRSEGGFTENLTKERISTMREQATSSNAPVCPICGKVMLLRNIKRGARQGQQFWGCSDYPNCLGKRDL